MKFSVSIAVLLFLASVSFSQSNAFYNVRVFGANGDGKTLDTDAVNKAIDSTAAKGGGTVYFPAGTYLCFSIRLKSNITIYLDNGATILAADPAVHKGKYDLPEPNEFDMYQDFGHSHWKNSLMWGIGIENFRDRSARAGSTARDFRGEARARVARGQLVKHRRAWPTTFRRLARPLRSRKWMASELRQLP
jgi:hypothetical protein